MLNILDKKSGNNKIFQSSVISNLRVFSKWEIINSFSLTEKHLFFRTKSYSAKLCKQVTLQNEIERYSIRLTDNEILGNMSLKSYKDCIYIIDFEIKTNTNFNRIISEFLDIAIEKAKNNTTDKKIIFNVVSDRNSGRIKKNLVNYGFLPEEEQSEYEKNMFGETFILYLDKNGVNNKVPMKNKFFLLSRV